jgi:hypothetical protein
VSDALETQVHEDEAAPPRWGIPDAALGFVGAYLLSGMTASLWVARRGVAEHSFGLAVATVTGLWLGFVGAAVVAARRKGSGSIVRDFGFRLEARDVPLGIAAGLLSQFLLIRLVYLPFGDRVEDLGRDNEAMVDSTHGIALAVLALLLAIGAPLVEELFFRGLVQRSLVRRLGPAPGIALGAVVFGATHFDLLGLLGLALFGLVLGVLAHRTGRLGPSIVAHIVFNAAAVAAFVVA